MLDKWLSMIFGPNGEHVIQKMQEFSQAKLDSCFIDEENNPCHLGELQEKVNRILMSAESGHVGKTSLSRLEESGCKTVLHGYIHNNHLLGNALLMHLGKILIGNICLIFMRHQSAHNLHSR